MNPSAAFGAFVTSRHASLPTTRSVSEISILQKEKMVQGHHVCQQQAGLAPQRDAGAHAGLISPFRPSFARCPAPALAGRPCPPFQVWVWLEDLPQPQEGPQMERGLAWPRGALPVTPSREGGVVGSQASRQQARFIKSHQEHRLGTAVTYPHFSL